MQTRCRQRLVERGPVGVLPGLNLGELLDDRPILAIKIGLDRSPLGIETKARLALATGERR
jgi:hypothetical protein